MIGEWNEKPLDETVRIIRSTGGEVTGVRGNIALQEQAETLIDTAIDNYGHIDILVNNVGVWIPTRALVR